MLMRCAVYLIMMVAVALALVQQRYQKSATRLTQRKGSFNDWILNQAGKDVKITVSDEYGGATCKDGAAKGDILFVLPLGLCLDLTKAVAFESILKSSNLRTGDYGMLALLLLSEKVLAQESKYFAYINNLPTVPPGVLSWDEDLLIELDKSTTRNTKAQVDAVNADADLLNTIKARSQSKLLSQIDLSPQEFRWAVGIVKSRAVYLDGKLSLVPGTHCCSFFTVLVVRAVW